MKPDVESRLKQLKDEYQKGQGQLMALEQETVNLKNTLLRISGAIQVLQELLSEQPSQNDIQKKNGLEFIGDSEIKS